MGLATAVLVAWFTSGLERNRALSAKKAEIFDSACTQVICLAFAYQVVRSIVDGIVQENDDSIMDAKVYELLVWCEEVARIKKQGIEPCLGRHFTLRASPNRVRFTILWNRKLDL